ncbi:MAG: DUF2125 domain-containing protein [Pseudomonadota bacterium]
MTFTRSILMTSAFAILAANPALADLTAEQVLADQLKQMQSYGLTAETTSQSKSGDVLTVDGYTSELVFPEGSFTMTMGGAIFTEDNGSVIITYPDEIPITIAGVAEGEEPFEMVMTLRQSGTRAVVTGIPEEIRYDFTAEAFSVDEIKFLEPAEAAEMDMTVDISLNGLSGFMEIVGGGTIRDYTSAFNFASMAATIAADVPEDDGAFNIEINGENISSEYSGRLAPQDFMASMAQTIEAGSRTVGTASHGPLTYALSADTPDGGIEMAAALASGTFDFKMDEDGLDYGGTSKDMTVTVGGSAMPLPPMSFSAAETGGRFALPVVPSEDSQGFALLTRMIGLELDPTIWGIFDPTGQLPRDPANLVIDLGGEVVLTDDIFDPEAMENLAGPPGQINALDVNDIQLSFAGAELTGNGEFAFNNEGFFSIPSGVANLKLTGGNGLLDTLVNMGLVPQEQALGARMMMGLFARPGPGDDTLLSTIEVKEDGSVLANGQRIQ